MLLHNFNINVAIAVILLGQKSLYDHQELSYDFTLHAVPDAARKIAVTFFPKGVEFERFFGDTRDPLEYFCGEIIW
jgi:hypothetical protein